MIAAEDVDIDEALLSEAARTAGTCDPSATVNAALRAAIDLMRAPSNG